MTKDNQNYAFKSELGLNEKIVREISAQKQEPEWMLDIRLKALQHFVNSVMPKWGPDLSALDPQNIFYYLKQTEKTEHSWQAVPENIKKTFEHLGLPQAEKNIWPALARSMNPKSFIII